jgi:IclR family pca regulon transcriptional regulator
LRVLAAFQPERPELSQTELAEVAGVTVPSALRIGHTLLELGYLTRNPQTRRYRLGPKVISLGLATLASMPLPDIAEPSLRRLRDETGETVKMAVMQDTDMVYIARFPSLRHPTTSVYVGSRLVAHTTSMGRAILAQLPPDQARRIVERSPRASLTSKSVTDVDAIMREIARTAERGYSINDQGLTMEHRSVGAALVTASGVPVGAINISSSVHRVSLEEMVERLAPAVVATAREISSLLPPHVETPTAIASTAD